jgi:hypothetical protein
MTREELLSQAYLGDTREPALVGDPYSAGISIEYHCNAIEFHAATAEEAEAKRDALFDIIQEAKATDSQDQ